MFTSNFLGLLSAIVYVAAYAAITIYSRLVPAHHDLYPFYALVTFGVAVHVSIVTIHMWHRIR